MSLNRADYHSFAKELPSGPYWQICVISAQG
jgi:hypothetical protein